MKVTLTILIEEELKKEFKKLCVENDESMKEVIIELIEELVGVGP